MRARGVPTTTAIRTRRLRQKASALAAVAFLLTAVAAACGDDDDGTSAATTSAGGAVTSAAAPTTVQPRRGGTLTYLYSFEGRSLDIPALSGANGVHGGDGIYGMAIFDALMWEDPLTSKIEMQTAESLTSTDAITWTLKLRPDIRFTDGTPYDAEAVKFNWERIADPANRSSNLSTAATIASMEAVDATTLRITLKQANGQFPRLVARRLPFIGSPTAMRTMGAEFGNAPVGAGPFVLRSWQRGNQLTNTRNPNYWNAPRPYVDELVVRLLSDNEQRYQSMAAGEGDVANPVLSFEQVDRARKAGLQVLETPYAVGGNYLVFNTKRPPFDDVTARRAVAAALDTAKHRDTVYLGGGGDLPTSVIRPPSPLHDPALRLTHDAAEARRLAAEYARAHGSPLEFTAMVTLQNRPTMEFYQAELAALGISVKLEVVAGGEFLPRLATRNFEASTFLLSGNDPEPDLYDSLHTGATRNFGDYSNPAMDAALDKGRTSLDERERKEAYKAVQELIKTDAPQAYTSGAAGYHFYGSHVRDLAASQGFILVDRVWLDS